MKRTYWVSAKFTVDDVETEYPGHEAIEGIADEFESWLTTLPGWGLQSLSLEEDAPAVERDYDEEEEADDDDTE